MVRYSDAASFWHQTRMANKESRYVVANWKQYLSYHQATALLSQIAGDKDLTNLKTNLIICPSYEVLDAARKELLTTNIELGAQTCSPYENGAHTGFVGVSSLYELGVSYCLVGHSERRAFETKEMLAEQTEELFTYDVMAPILCVGEQEQSQSLETTIVSIEEQLKGPLARIEDSTTNPHVLIAYEPAYAIGTGLTPDKEYIQAVTAHIHTFCKGYDYVAAKVLYGGSVSATTAEMLLSIPQLDGLLIGKASTDFQELKKIVLLQENRL